MLVVHNKALGACVGGAKSSLAQTESSKGARRRERAPRLDDGVEVSHTLFGVLRSEFFESKVLGQSDGRGS